MVVASMTDSSRAEYLFADDEQRRLEATLTRITSRLEGIAQRYGLLIAADAGRGWPGRTLSRRIWTKTYRLRISLEPTYVRTGSIRWNVHEVWMREIASVYRKLLSFQVLAECVEIDKSADHIGDLIERAVAENSRKW
jgi:hypothetical protein